MHRPLHRKLLVPLLALLALALLPSGAALALPMDGPPSEGPPEGLADLLLEGAKGETIAEFASTQLGEASGLPEMGPQASGSKPDLVVPPGPPARAGSPVGPPAMTPPDPGATGRPVVAPAFVPEPTTALLLGAGLGGLAIASRRRPAG